MQFSGAFHLARKGEVLEKEQRALMVASQGPNLHLHGPGCAKITPCKTRVKMG